MPRDKSGHFYYEWYPTIFQADTQHLSLAEDGAYRRLIDHYMQTKSPLPIDDKALARVIGIGIDEWVSIRPQVVTYFKPTGLLLHHKFCDEVLSKHSARLLKSKNNGSRGGRPSIGKAIVTTQPVIETKPSGNPITEQNRTEHKEKESSAAKTDFEKIYEAGIAVFPQLAAQNTSAIHAWIAAGVSPELDAAPEFKRLAGANARSWSYFTGAITDAKATRTTPLPHGVPKLAKPDPNHRSGAKQVVL
jgi:uncharacterized protein YdaU (DUF1376 family)